MIDTDVARSHAPAKKQFTPSLGFDRPRLVVNQQSLDMSQDKVKQHILVTGASGFTGGHLCRRLLANGHHVRVLARPNSDLSGLSGDNLEIHIGDL